MGILRAAEWYWDKWRLNVVFAYFKKTLNDWKALVDSRQGREDLLRLFRQAKAMEPRVNSINAVLGPYLCRELGSEQYVVIDIDVELAPWQQEAVAEIARETPVVVAARGYNIWFKMGCSEVPADMGKLVSPSGKPLGDFLASRHCVGLVPSARVRSDGSIYVTRFHYESTRCAEGDEECARRPWSLKVEPRFVTWDYLQQLVSDLLSASIELVGKRRAVVERRAASGYAPKGEREALAPIIPFAASFREWIEALSRACRDGVAPRCVCWALFEHHPHGERWCAMTLATLAWAASSLRSCEDWSEFLDHMATVIEDFPEDEGGALDRKAEYYILSTPIDGYCAPRYRSVSWLPAPFERLCTECIYRTVCNRRSHPLRIAPYVVARFLQR